MTRALGRTVTVGDAGALLGRILLGAIFIWAGCGKALATEGTLALFSKLGLPLPIVAYTVTLVVELGVGLMFVLGLLTRRTALVLGFWCIATALVAHADLSNRNNANHFFKNVAMLGGFLYAAVYGPGAFSIDATLRKRRQDLLAADRPLLPTCAASGSRPQGGVAAR